MAEAIPFQVLNSETMNIPKEYKDLRKDIMEFQAEKTLWSYLQEKQEERFIELASNHKPKINFQPFLNNTVEKDLPKIFRFLLENGVILFENEDPHTNFNVDTLNKLIKNYNTNEMSKKYFDLLIKTDYIKIFVNEKSSCGENYPLHYAARYANSKIVQILLKNGASLGNRNKNDDLTISEISPEILKQHFNSCIEFQDKNEGDSRIIFNYTTLLPSENHCGIFRKRDVEKGTDEEWISEIDAVLYMGRTCELKGLLTHPLITSFLQMKWHKTRWIYYINLFFYILFCLSLFIHEITYDGTLKYVFCSSYIFATTFVLFLREIFQMFIHKRKYFSNVENYIELALIISVGLVLFTSTEDQSLRIQLRAVVLLLAAFVLLLLLGKYPWLSRDIIMFRTVSRNFFKFFLLYSILILAFSFSFYMLFQQTKPNSTNTNSTAQTTEGGNQNFFVNPAKSIFKTIIMMTGEFDSSNVEFQDSTVISYIIFIIFVLTISVILLNLLNGLAVNDTRQVIIEAEIIATRAQAEYIASTESLFLKNYVFIKFCKLFLFFSKKKNCLGSFISIKDDYLKDGRLVVFVDLKQNGLVEGKKVYLYREIICGAKLLHQEMKERKKWQIEEQMYNMLVKINNFIEEQSKKEKNV